MRNFDSNRVERDVYTVLGWIIASMSLISFVQRLFSIGLGAIATSFIDYYRRLAHAVFAFPAELFGVDIPDSLVDFWALSFVCAGAYAKSKNVEFARGFSFLKLEGPPIKLRVFVFIIFGFTGIGLFVPLSALSINTYIDGDITRDALKNLAIISLIVVLFYMLNAFSPSA